MSKLNPTPSQLKHKLLSKLKKKADRVVKQYAARIRWVRAGCCKAEDDEPAHDWQPWDCGCAWGCEHCKYGAVCSQCGDMI